MATIKKKPGAPESARLLKTELALSSENELQAELHTPCRSGRKDLPGRPLTLGRVRVTQVYVVGHIKHFPPELQVFVLREPEFLG